VEEIGKEFIVQVVIDNEAVLLGGYRQWSCTKSSWSQTNGKEATFVLVSLCSSLFRYLLRGYREKIYKSY
jgi:hypothetical protein